MGNPFNFDEMTPSNELPAEINGDHYLTIASVTNTIYKIFGVSEDHYWKNGRNGPPARMLADFIA
jgi:hypothetical protein